MDHQPDIVDVDAAGGDVGGDEGDGLATSEVVEGPLALALGLPADFEYRVLIIDLTLGAVLMSLLIQGTTISRLLNRLGVAASK